MRQEKATALTGERQPIHRLRTLLLLALTCAVLNATLGCGSKKNADQSDPNPDYYKGQVFHSKQQKH